MSSRKNLFRQRILRLATLAMFRFLSLGIFMLLGHSSCLLKHRCLPQKCVLSRRIPLKFWNLISLFNRLLKTLEAGSCELFRLPKFEVSFTEKHWCWFTPLGPDLPLFLCLVWLKVSLQWEILILSLLRLKIDLFYISFALDKSLLQ